MIELEARHSHLYPGAGGRLTGGAEGEAVIAFADGARASAILAGNVLHVAPYRTAAGAEIPARDWLIELGADGFRVTGRMRRA